MEAKLQSSMDANQQSTDSNYSGTPIEGTPFHKISNGEKAFLAMGNMRMTEAVPVDEFEEFVEKNQVNIIADMVIIIVDKMINEKTKQ